MRHQFCFVEESQPTCHVFVVTAIDCDELKTAVMPAVIPCLFRSPKNSTYVFIWGEAGPLYMSPFLRIRVLHFLSHQAELIIRNIHLFDRTEPLKGQVKRNLKRYNKNSKKKSSPRDTISLPRNHFVHSKYNFVSIKVISLPQNTISWEEITFRGNEITVF